MIGMVDLSSGFFLFTFLKAIKYLSSWGFGIIVLAQRRLPILVSPGYSSRTTENSLGMPLSLAISTATRYGIRGIDGGITQTM